MTCWRPWTDDLAGAPRLHLTGEVRQNCADSDLTGWVSTYFGASYRRLQQVKRRYDPDDFFHYAQRNPG